MRHTARVTDARDEWRASPE